jgi:hypothetical protein
VTSVLAGLRERRPFAAEGGRTGAAFESALLADGTPVVLKHVTCDDWLPRALGTTDLLYRMWFDGIFARMPRSIDHLNLSVEPEDGGHVIVMRDATDEMLGDHRVLTREENMRVLRATDDLHAAFWGEPLEGLVSLDDHYRCMTPGWVKEHGAPKSPVKVLIPRGWELFADVAPADITEVMSVLSDDPSPLVRQLETRPQTLVHGDLRLHNLALNDDNVVLFDWELAGLGPPSVDIAWYLIISASRIKASREQVLDDYREIAGERYDTEAMELGLIGALLRLGWNKALDIIENPDENVRRQERSDLDWWVKRVRRALEVWSPV